jgi:hypothetical protein
MKRDEKCMKCEARRQQEEGSRRQQVDKMAWCNNIIQKNVQNNLIIFSTKKQLTVTFFNRVHDG